ncbi:enoyl-CoA hydratase/isomerase [Bacillus sp. OxB-1]|uniref:enoyl-CoA hydratase-related protein n=1 Tax=Bacillus sp. (strain OxB-1) TaxID=98228 RepID=UPI000581FA5D|nr:enoyl-CoA hydratase-related protein [Bacillus sp. OxB-1]BAQ09307.1 enoyl-CoA hydratase/isomerase [Bacillus sp. OxB-1]
MTFEHLLVDIKDYVATVTINRPPVNPLNSAVFKELGNLIDQLDQNDEVRAIVLTGSGEKAFVAGADIMEMASLDLAGINQMNKVSRSVFNKIEQSTKPIIAAINGLALGGGLELALTCDLRISTERAKFAFPEVGLGIIPGGGGTQRLQKITGMGVAKEMLFFGEMISAERANQLNLVNKIVPQEELLPTAQAWAAKLASKPPIALQMAKLAVNTGSNTDIDSGLIVEAACFGNAFSTEDRKEGLTAFVEKREPVYAGR